MGYVIFFCLLIGYHGLQANVLERRPQTRTTAAEVVSNIKTNLNSQKSFFDEITETNDSSTRNHPTDDFNKQIAEYDTETAPVGRVNLTRKEEEILETGRVSLTSEQEEILETGRVNLNLKEDEILETGRVSLTSEQEILDRPTTAPKQLGTKLNPFRSLKTFLRRLLIGSKLEREIASEVVASSTQTKENITADNTKRYSRIKSHSETVHSRDVSHSKRTGLEGKFQAEFRRAQPPTSHLQDALISAFLRRYSRRIFNAIVARYDSIARRELRRIAQEVRRDRYSQITKTDREAARHGETLVYQMPPNPRSAPSFDASPVAYQDEKGPHAAYQDKHGPPAAYQDKDGPTTAYQDRDGLPAAYQDAKGPPAAYQDAKGPPPAYQDGDGPPVAYQDKHRLPVAYQDMHEPPPAYQDKHRPPVAYHDAKEPPSAYQDKDGPTTAYQDAKGPPVDYQDKDGPTTAYQDEYDELRQDGIDSSSDGSFDEWPVREMEAVEDDRTFRRVRRGAADVPGKPTEAPTNNNVVEDPASEPGMVATEPSAEAQQANAVMTTQGPPSKMPVVLGILGGMVLGAVLAVIIVVVYLNVKKKKPEQDPLKPGQAPPAPGAADKAAKDIAAATASHAAMKKTASKAGKPPAPGHPPPKK